MSHFRCKTYKQLVDKFQAAGERVRKGTSTENFVAAFTDGFRKEIDPRAVEDAAAKAGFLQEWLAVQKKKKARTASDCSFIPYCCWARSPSLPHVALLTFFARALSLSLSVSCLLARALDVSNSLSSTSDL